MEGVKGKIACLFWVMALLLSFASLGSAEMTAMSLQERVRRSDAVVVGEILESRDILKWTEAGIEVWQATCRVDRYITAQIDDPNVEEGKKVSIILEFGKFYALNLNFTIC